LIDLIQVLLDQIIVLIPSHQWTSNKNQHIPITNKRYVKYLVVGPSKHFAIHTGFLLDLKCFVVYYHDFSPLPFEDYRELLTRYKPINSQLQDQHWRPALTVWLTAFFASDGHQGDHSKTSFLAFNQGF
jgi:hypothetical protein